MNSVILQIASRHLKYILWIFAVMALLRGHNHPGGGFIGGLLASLSFVIRGLAFSVEEVRLKMKFKPEYYIGTGLILVLLSTVPGFFASGIIMKGTWGTINLPLDIGIKLGTPLLFDIGVFLAVTGVSLVFFFNLSNKE